MDIEILIICFFAGFAAQMIDGSLGMGYGVILSIMLFSMGLPPVSVSASVHLAKFFATSVSGFSHLKLGNVDKTIATRLAIGGVIGGVFGSLTLKSLPTEIIKPGVAVYLTVMGILIVYKAFHQPQVREKITQVGRLGLLGGFCDAIGGGGWGAIVTSGLLMKGKNPRQVIGSVSLAEFFVSITIVSLLITEVPELRTQLQIIVGLVSGSMLAAPAAAYLCRHVSPRPLMMTVGGLIILLSGSTVVSLLLERF